MFFALGVRIPKDVRIVGIDNITYANLLPVPPTTVHQPCLEIGIAAVTAMLGRIRQPDMAVRDILIGTHLVIRDSCGAKVAPPIAIATAPGARPPR